MTAPSQIRRVVRRLAKADPGRPAGATENDDTAAEAQSFDQAISRLETHIRTAAPGDRMEVFRARARETFAPLLDRGVSADAVLTHIYSIANQHDLGGNSAAIDEIASELTGLLVPSAQDEPDEDGDMEEPRAQPLSFQIVEPWWQDPSTISPRDSLDPSRHLIRGAPSVTIAAGGRGKTTRSLFEAVQMAVGFDLKTRSLLAAGKLRIWVVNGEEDQAELDRRLAAVCLHYGVTRNEVGSRLFVQSVRNTPLRVASVIGGRPSVDTGVQAFFVGFMKERAIDVLIVDPVISFHGLNENDNGHMDLLMKQGFGGIASRTNAACDLLHHVGKSRPGLAEASVDDGRGASAIIWACRSARVFNFMTTEEARKLGVIESERRRHVRIANGKANNGPIGAAKWIRLEVEKLPNGDEVAVASPWTPPTSLDGVTSEGAELAQRLAATGEYREDNRSPEWFGYAIAPHLKINVTYRGDNDQSDVVRIGSIIKNWLKTKVLSIEERKDKNGKSRKFIVAGTHPQSEVVPASQDEEDSLE